MIPQITSVFFHIVQFKSLCARAAIARAVTRRNLCSLTPLGLRRSSLVLPQLHYILSKENLESTEKGN